MERKKSATTTKRVGVTTSSRRATSAPATRRAATKVATRPAGRPVIPSVPVGYEEPDPRQGALDLSQVSTETPRRPRRVGTGVSINGRPAPGPVDMRLVSKSRTVSAADAPRAASHPAPVRRPQPVAAPAAPARGRGARAPIARAVTRPVEPSYEPPRRGYASTPSDELQDQFHLPEIHERVFDQPVRRRRAGKAGTIIVAVLVLAVIAAAAVFVYVTYFQAAQ